MSSVTQPSVQPPPEEYKTPRSALSKHTSFRRPKRSKRQDSRDNKHASLVQPEERPRRIMSVGEGNFIATSTISAPMERLKNPLPNATKCYQVLKFLRDFRIIFCSPLFLRHRNRFVILLLFEIMMPALVTMLVLAVFTNTSSWKEAVSYKGKANSRSIQIPEKSMDEAIKSFRTAHADRWNRPPIYFSPATDFTIKLMESAVRIIGIDGVNSVSVSGLGSEDMVPGAIGFNNTAEMMERAIARNKETGSVGAPVIVNFKYNETLVSNVTGIPYHVNYTIRTFDQAISRTEELQPPVGIVFDDAWQSPYMKNGFIGLQYAIDEALIRLILARQRDHEMKNLEKKDAERAQALALEQPDYLSSQDIDTDKLKSLVEQTLSQIQRAKVRKAESEYFGSDEDEETPKPLEFSVLDESEKLLRSPSTFRSLASSTALPTRTLLAKKFDQTSTTSFRQAMANAVIFALMISYCFMSVCTVHQISKERSSGTKELLQIRGMPHYMYWILLFFHAIIFRTITSTLVWVALIIDYGNGAILNHTRGDVALVCVYVHQVSLTFLNYYIASFNIAMRFGYLFAVSICVMSFYTPNFIPEEEVVTVLEMALSILFPNWSFKWAMSYMLECEAKEEGLTWEKVWSHEQSLRVDTTTNHMNVGDAIIKMICIGFIYYVLAVNVGVSSSIPLLTSVRRLKTSFAKLRKKRSTNKLHPAVTRYANHVAVEPIANKPAVYEDPHQDRPCFVKMRNLSKNYGLQKLALDSLSMDIVHEGVTVIMGHSGSGKTTLISILAGLMKPSNGEAIICGYNASTETSKARQFIGLCPQTIITFNLLTIREHVHLCYKLRGYPTKRCNEMTSALLSQLKLWGSRSSLPNKLTTNQLQRLGLALCLVDAPKILLLDELTRGMDSMSRREIWDIILAMRSNHSIIVTTNYMDEAEHLADQLALLAHGRLVCYGSLDYLKSQYDTGFFLKLNPFENAFLDSNAALNFVRSHLGSDVKVKKHRRLKDVDTLELELPSKEKEKFADFCDELDLKKNYLNIHSYSIRQVNLNDIFIKICNSVSADGNAVDFYVRRDSAGDIKTVLHSEIPEIPSEQWSNVSKMSHFKTCCRRILIAGKSTRIWMGLHYVMPLFVIYIVILETKNLISPTFIEHPELALVSSSFGPSQRMMTQVVDDDALANYSAHLSRILGPNEEPLSKGSFIVPRLYQMQAEANATGQSGVVQKEHMVAFQLGQRPNGEYGMTGVYTSGSLHSAPVAVNVMDNAILSAISDSERGHVPNWHQYRVAVHNMPMPVVRQGSTSSASTSLTYKAICDLICVLLAIMMSLAIGSLAYSSVILLEREIDRNIKHLIMMCGVSPFIYWVSYIFVNAVFMACVSGMIVLILLADINRIFNDPPVIFAVWIVAALYMLWSGMNYSLYATFRICRIIGHSQSYILLNFTHFLFGCLLFIPLNGFAPMSGFALILKNIFIVLSPPFTLTHAILVILRVLEERNICNELPPFIMDICRISADADYHTHQVRGLLNVSLDNIDSDIFKCCPRKCKGILEIQPNTCYEKPDFFLAEVESWENFGMISIVVIFLLQGLVFGVLILMGERKTLERALQSCLYKRKTKVGDVEDPDKTGNPDVAQGKAAVKEMVKRLRTYWPQDLCLICDGLTKSSSKRTIIKDFNLAARKGQCVAILGRGNSGKSAIANMIAGITVPTRGNCYIKDANLFDHRRQYLSHIGYAPQKGGLYDLISGTEMLELFGRMRGIPGNMLNTYVTKWLCILGLEDVANIRIIDLGDGLRQRLSIAVALIGSTDLIVLDEPTTGVEPAARERLWCVLEQLMHCGYTIILTTCSTDEAFSLAHKMIIVTEGHVQCDGKPDEIRNKYARGHTITFQLKHDLLTSDETSHYVEERLEEFKVAVANVYKHVDLLDEHDELLMFFIRDAKLTWAEAYRRGHRLALDNSDIIASYEITEGGVDDIFVFLSNKFNGLEPAKETDERFNRRSVINETKHVEPSEEDDLKEIKKLQASYRRRTSLY